MLCWHHWHLHVEHASHATSRRTEGRHVCKQTDNRIECTLCAVLHLDMVDSTGEVESDGGMRGIEHMRVYKERLTNTGKAASHSRYNAPQQQDVLAVVGGMIVADSRQVRVCAWLQCSCEHATSPCVVAHVSGMARAHQLLVSCTLANLRTMLIEHDLAAYTRHGQRVCCK
jgi:hypothetical protein